MGSWRRALVNISRILNSTPVSTSWMEASTLAGSETLLFRPRHLDCCNRISIISQLFSTNSQSFDVDLSDEESRRRLVNRLLYRSRQRGFLELDLVLGKWVEDNIHSMDADGIKSLIHVLDQENPDLWKWLTGQEQPPEEVKTNPVFSAVQGRVMNNLNLHASPKTRSAPGQPWVRGWDDFKKGRDTPITGNQ